MSKRKIELKVHSCGVVLALEALATREASDSIEKQIYCPVCKRWCDSYEFVDVEPITYKEK